MFILKIYGVAFERREAVEGASEGAAVAAGAKTAQAQTQKWQPKKNKKH